MRNLTLICIVSAGAGALWAEPADATAYSYQPFDFPGMTSTDPTGINSSGVIVGSTTGGAFYYNGASFILDTYDAAVGGISNSGNSAGYFYNSRDVGSSYMGFTQVGGTRRDFGGQPTYYTRATGINDGGFASGYTFDVNGAHGFILPPAGSAQYPNTIVLNAPNNSGPSSPGNASSQGTYAEGINDSNVVVGFSVAAAAQAFEYSLSTNTYTGIEVPGAYDTRAYGINNDGVVVGSIYSQTPGQQGFVDDHGVFSILNYPGSIYTTATGINDDGTVVGTYTVYGDASLTLHGFVATPLAVPEPPSAAVFGVGAFAAAAWRRWSRRPRKDRDQA